jgi:hypothetical protein
MKKLSKDTFSKKKAGLTLIEAIMAVGIFSMGIAGFTVLFSKVWKSNAFILEEGQSAMIVSQAVTEVTGDLRRVKQGDDGSYPIRSGNKFDLVVFIDIDHDMVTEKVHYYLSGTDFVMGYSKPTGSPVTYPSGDTTVKTLATRIVNTSANPIFYYYNNLYPGDLAHNPLTTPINTGDVRLVKIHLMINIDPSKAPDNVNVQSFAQLRNINGYIQ